MNRVLLVVMALLLAGCAVDEDTYETGWDGAWVARVHLFGDPCDDAPRSVALDIHQGVCQLDTTLGQLVTEWLPDGGGAELLGGAVLAGWTLEDTAFEVCGEGLCGTVAWSRADERCERPTQLWRAE